MQALASVPKRVHRADGDVAGATVPPSFVRPSSLRVTLTPALVAIGRWVEGRLGSYHCRWRPQMLSNGTTGTPPICHPCPPQTPCVPCMPLISLVSPWAERALVRRSGRDPTDRRRRPLLRRLGRLAARALTIRERRHWPFYNVTLKSVVEKKRVRTETWVITKYRCKPSSNCNM